MKIFIRSVVALFVLCFFSLEAMGAGGFKIGVVDIQRFQKKSRAFQKTKVELKNKFEAMQKKLEDERRALLNLESDFKKQSMMLSLDAKEDKKRALEKKNRYYKYLYEDLTQEMKNAEIEATREVGKELEKVVDEIGKREGYILILEKRALGLIYYHDAIDITDQVTGAYDRMRQ